MEPEIFHLIDMAMRPGGALMVASIFVGLPLLFLVILLLNRRRRRPVLTGAVIFLLCFGFSQCFADNRTVSARIQLIAGGAMLSAILAWYVNRSIKRLREVNRN